MKRSSRIAAVSATSVTVVLVLLAVFPLFFSDRIAQRVQVEVNRNVNAHVSWRQGFPAQASRTKISAARRLRRCGTAKSAARRTRANVDAGSSQRARPWLRREVTA